MPDSKPRMAVVGLGSMGFGMATSLRRKGYEVTGCDVAPDSVARFVGEGGKGAKTPSEAAKAADIVISVVVTMFTTPKPVAELTGLVWSLTPRDELRKAEVGADAAWYRKPMLLGGVVLLIALVLNIVFW